MLEERSQRATLNYQQLVKKGLAPKDMNDENINAVYGLQPEKTAEFRRIFEYTCERYWELYHSFVASNSMRSFSEAISCVRNAMRWSTTNESMLRVHKAVTEALEEEAKGAAELTVAEGDDGSRLCELELLELVQQLPDVEIAKLLGLQHELQFNKAFLDPLKVILDAIGWNVEKTVNLELFFG